MLPEFFTLRNWARFCFYLNNQRYYGQMDATGTFGASNLSKTTLHTVLIVVESRGRGGRNAAGIFHSEKLGLTLFLPQQPALLWTDGCYRRIRRIKLVQNQHSTLF